MIKDLSARLTEKYEEIFKYGEKAKSGMSGAQKKLVDKALAKVSELAGFDQELGKIATNRISQYIDPKAAKQGKAKAGDLFAKNWTGRGDNLTKAINASKDANGNVSSNMLDSRLNDLTSKPGMGNLAKTLTDAEKSALNARGITISGTKFKLPNFADPTLGSMLKTMNTMDKGGNLAIRDSAGDLAKIGVTQSAKTGKWAMTKAGLSAVGKM